MGISSGKLIALENHTLFLPNIIRARRESLTLLTNHPFHTHFQHHHLVPKFRFIGWYLNQLESHPVVTKTFTTSLIYAAADLTAQMISSSLFSSFDLIRTLRMAGYGLLFLGPSQHIWFNFMSKFLPKRDVPTTLKKIFMGQAVYGPANATLFFSYNAALQGKLGLNLMDGRYVDLLIGTLATISFFYIFSYNLTFLNDCSGSNAGESGNEIVARLKRDLLPTLKNGLLYWPACDFATYKFVPVHLQPLVNSICSYVWTIYLTYMASLKKARTD